MSGAAPIGPDACERVFHAAVARGDAKGVEAALMALTPQDPKRAVDLYDSLSTALALQTFLVHLEGE